MMKTLKSTALTWLSIAIKSGLCAVLCVPNLTFGAEKEASVVLSPTIPLAITTTKPISLSSLQHDFDVFSWQSFVALNWPAQVNGQANTDVTIGQAEASLRVWQHWQGSRDIFLPAGAAPPAFGLASGLPDVCKTLDPNVIPKEVIYLSQVGKTPNVLDESGEPFQTGPLIDQNGQYTRFEILTNEAMFDYIVDHQLYSQAGQKAFTAETNFPSSDPTSGQVGAMMLKAAWVKMGGKFDPTQFYTTHALVYNNPDEQAGVKPACSLEVVGLVGFHIGHKTKTDPQWIWSTFEHIANVPEVGDKPLLPAYHFFNAQCVDCKVNQPPARPWDPAIPFTAPSQIMRAIPLTDEVKALNARYQAALKAVTPLSVWANYQLISTQWPTNPSSKVDPTGAPAPAFLANATLETYIQGEVRQTSSSCIGCHNNATTTNGRFADFTYLLQRAQ